MRLIIGKHINGTIYYWRVDGKYPDIGDYAIVENKNDYSLVKIIGLCETEDKYVTFITNRGEIKNVVKTIPRSDIRND